MSTLGLILVLAGLNEIVMTINAYQKHHASHKSTQKHLQRFEFTNLTFLHAECPVYDVEKNILYWVDVSKQDVHAVNYGDWTHRVKHIGYGQVNVVVPVANSDRILVSVRSELFLLDFDKPGDEALRLITAIDLGKPDNVINEGKADVLGRFWGGTKGPQEGDKVKSDEAILFSLEQPWLTPQVQLKPVTISNGLVWSSNNSLMYYIDSATASVDVFDFDLTRGRISNRRTVLDIRKNGYKKALPDGLTIDRDGMLWTALIFGSTVIRFDPNTSRILEKYRLPVTRPTSLTWAGQNHEDLIVTTSRRNLNKTEVKRQPLSGTIFVIRHLRTGGVPDHKFVFPNADYY